MDSVFTVSVLCTLCVLSLVTIWFFRRACDALAQIGKNIAAIPANLSEIIPDISDPTLVAEMTSLTQRMTNLESFTDSRYKKMAAIDSRLGKHSRNENEEEEDGHSPIDYDELAQALKSQKQAEIVPDEPQNLSEAELIRLELGL